MKTRPRETLRHTGPGILSAGKSSSNTTAFVRAGKERLFAGVIAGWESNLAYGYCSLTQLGYSAQNPPPDFDRAREQVLQRHIELWAKGILLMGEFPATASLLISDRYRNAIMTR